MRRSTLELAPQVENGLEMLALGVVQHVLLEALDLRTDLVDERKVEVDHLVAEAPQHLDDPSRQRPPALLDRLRTALTLRSGAR